MTDVKSFSFLGFSKPAPPAVPQIPPTTAAVPDPPSSPLPKISTLHPAEASGSDTGTGVVVIQEPERPVDLTRLKKTPGTSPSAAAAVDETSQQQRQEVTAPRLTKHGYDADDSMIADEEDESPVKHTSSKRKSPSKFVDDQAEDDGEDAEEDGDDGDEEGDEEERDASGSQESEPRVQHPKTRSGPTLGHKVTVKVDGKLLSNAVNATGGPATEELIRFISASLTPSANKNAGLPMYPRVTKTLSTAYSQVSEQGQCYIVRFPPKQDPLTHNELKNRKTFRIIDHMWVLVDLRGAYHFVVLKTFGNKRGNDFMAMNEQMIEEAFGRAVITASNAKYPNGAVMEYPATNKTTYQTYVVRNTKPPSDSLSVHVKGDAKKKSETTMESYEVEGQMFPDSLFRKLTASGCYFLDEETGICRLSEKKRAQIKAKMAESARAMEDDTKKKTSSNEEDSASQEQQPKTKQKAKSPEKEEAEPKKKVKAAEKEEETEPKKRAKATGKEEETEPKKKVKAAEKEDAPAPAPKRVTSGTKKVVKKLQYTQLSAPQKNFVNSISGLLKDPESQGEVGFLKGILESCRNASPKFEGKEPDTPYVSVASAAELKEAAKAADGLEHMGHFLKAITQLFPWFAQSLVLAEEAEEEAKRKAKEEAERKAKAKEEAERKAKEEAERKAKEEAERKAKNADSSFFD